MLDIETLGTAPGSVITSIGAVRFDPRAVGTQEEFRVNVCPESCCKFGLTMDPATVVWWLKQPEAARTAMLGDQVHLDAALDAFSAWFPQGDTVWANGPSFDVALMEAAYRITARPAPWRYNASRCVRTVIDLAGLTKDELREAVPAGPGPEHEALSDAIWQARAVQLAVGRLAASLRQ